MEKESDFSAVIVYHMKRPANLLPKGFEEKCRIAAKYALECELFFKNLLILALTS